MIIFCNFAPKRGNMKKNQHGLKDLAKKFKSLGHPVRLQILKLLKDEPNLNVTNIYTKLKVDQPVISHHLGLLSRCGLLIRKRIGRENFYQLNTQGFEELLSEMKDCISK